MRTIFIAGAGSGVGKSLTSLLLNSGVRVIGTHFQSEPWEHENLEWQQVDFSNPNSTIVLPESLDGLAYCPGAIVLKPFGRISHEDYIKDYELQVLGAMRLIREALPALKKSGHGSVLMFSTVAVQSGFPFHAQVAASKGAIEALTRTLAAELSPTVRVNCIAPSLTDTPLAQTLLNTEEKRNANAMRNPMKRLGKPEDIAAMASFLLSADSSWITGQVMHVDGGMSAIKM
ncbi:MAG: SDR family oxidoreductase [Flavobacteriales bacterium]|nr:SDR family oxidoreductase [Flavobacteriales bacterium]